MNKRMVTMLIVMGILFGSIFGFQFVKSYLGKKFLRAHKEPPAVVSTMVVDYQPWQPQIKSVGSLRALQGVDVTTEIEGLVRSIYFQSGDNVKKGKVLVQLNADSDVAQLRSLQANYELAETVYHRDLAQYAIEAISKATLDADLANLKNKKALAEQQAALVQKKTIRAPFSGRLGITTIQPGQYLNPGDKIVTLQQIDPIYIDFLVPQQQLSHMAIGQLVTIYSDSYPKHTFTGSINALDPKVDVNTRNIQVEATLQNKEHDAELLPGMFATVIVNTGTTENYLTLPQAAISFNPYGATLFVVTTSKDSKGKKILTAKQTFIETGETRGDQITILEGVKKGDLVVTSGQLKLHNGSQIQVNNEVQPRFDKEPMPKDQ